MVLHVQHPPVLFVAPADEDITSVPLHPLCGTAWECSWVSQGCQGQPTKAKQLVNTIEAGGDSEIYFL
jgi:hypothetical protein